MVDNTLTRRPRVIVPTAVDNGPTAERMLKEDFEWAPDRTRVATKVSTPICRRKSDALSSLLKSGQIEQQHVNAAHRWYRDFVLSEVGYFEAPEMRADFLADEKRWEEQAQREAAWQAAANEGLKHDNIAWAIKRGKAACRLSVIRGIVRQPGETLLKFIVADGVTFVEMARHLIPQIVGDNGARLVKAQCALVLQQLEDVYRPENRHLFDICYRPREDVIAASRSRAVNFA